jgi:DNA topoisomerase-2
LEFDCREGKLV